ncbi:MAG: SAM-dependent chlorinase/fluorinase [Gemmatimonadetes bacterium]|uniref:SAM-dependent chlorinase/fluorinase n=1 Tax=Candidatus Kutchimonas denitrificans TaxID=3056748 RepID=A0AAE4Z858_9BACT|nr:SAM-dependent chlorinase/fluorinase [Gemmatimonadota bacterium]NIR75590.1 SAM-dependent chlorinase/fluorinase [Candidatus Kutchimonas denitrificans]NIS01904.1 SAM-dependent chlorinase/fluorinase [Gemmatimonadota bacterium]NIT67685.1 SAM-dependent chlorinase/fluorinase [Gemmatimonadota bacterium]NIU53559.1 hypothetical protein [Gemmatimonadota bacterium]
MPGIVTVLSDFGTSDGFVAAMKGVVLSIAPDAKIVDATHDIAPGDVEAAAFVLSQYWQLYPAGAVHLAVVDPGVGSGRRALAVEADGRYLAAPDNGLLTRVLADSDAWCAFEITEPRYTRPDPSSTFHGRDIFAPAAAHLAAGVDPSALGPAVKEPVTLPIEPPSRDETTLQGRVAHIDRFGNLISDLPGDWVEGDWRFEVRGREVGALRRTYADVATGELVTVIGSLGTVEVAVRDGSAAKRIGAARGDPVIGRLIPG